MRHGRFTAFLFFALALALAPVVPQAPDRIEVEINKAAAPVKIALPTPTGGDPDRALELIQTVRDDLEFSGYFDVVDPARYNLAAPSGSDGQPAHEAWLSIGADALVRTRLTLAGDRIDLEARLYDNASATTLFARRFAGSRERLRRVAHQLADDIQHHYTGRRGVALTRIAFVSRHGKAKEIYLMDYDGRNIRRLTTSRTINLSPAWSPSADELAFVSWRGKQPGLYAMNSEGKLGHLAVVGGELSSAPEWSPDGRELAYSSNADGNTEIYVLQRSTGKNRRLTYHAAIDTAPDFSPNGREIAFTSDRAGTPQIYIMDADGLSVRRVSRQGSYNESAAWSPRGDQLAFASRIDGRFEIVLLDLGSGRQTQLTRGAGNNENPCWSPDGRHLVFSSNRAGSYDIYTMRADGSDVRRLSRGGDSITPDWSR
jgi:TolB protein